MDIFRFVVQAYPSPTHPKYHEWQKATLVLLIANTDPHEAEQKSLDEIYRRGWVPESYDTKDILIEDVIKSEGGELWDAYLEAKKMGMFWIESLDTLPMTGKDNEVWGTGLKLDEEFVDQLIIDSGGHRVTREEAGDYQEKNADYVLAPYILELKQFEQEGLEVPTRQKKIAEIFDRDSLSGPAQELDPYVLEKDGFQEYWDVVGVPIQKKIKAASKQVKSTLSRLGEEKYEGGVILLNTGYLTVPHGFLVAMAEKYAAKDTSSISKVVVISSWTITNGFDTAVNYGFHPREPDCKVLSKLNDTFWKTVERMMTQMMTGDLDASKGMQNPMSPTHFHSGDKAYTFGVPHIESSLPKKKDDT